jgi:hypothetical protein
MNNNPSRREVLACAAAMVASTALHIAAGAPLSAAQMREAIENQAAIAK